MINFSPRVWHGREAHEMQDLLFKDRLIFINTDIEPEVSLAICQQIMVLNQQDAERPIKLHLLSPGGSVNCALAIVDTMRTLSCPVETTVMGIAASAAALILSAGAKGGRRATQYSRIMIHEIASKTEGKLSVMLDSIKEVQVLDEVLNTMLSLFTGKSREEIEKCIRKDYYMSATEAKDFGLIDEVIAWK